MTSKKETRIYCCAPKSEQAEGQRQAGVYCTHKCARCGFNPEEQARRFSTGRMVEQNGLRSLHFKSLRKKAKK